MATMIWDGVETPLPDRDGVQIDDQFIGASRRMASGRLRTDIVAVKRRVRVTWSGCTQSERDALRARYLASGEAVITLPDGQTFTGVPKVGGWSERQIYDARDQPYYVVSVTFEEV
ncbi:MAG: hypothetical protein Kow0047_15930 [Anaerolineae bacterium]